MSTLPTEPIYSKLLITAIKPEFIAVRSQIATIVAMLSVENILIMPHSSVKTEREVLGKRNKLLSGDSDHLSLLKICNSFEYVLKHNGKAKAKKFCADFFLNDKSIIQAL